MSSFSPNNAVAPLGLPKRPPDVLTGSLSGNRPSSSRNHPATAAQAPIPAQHASPLVVLTSGLSPTGDHIEPAMPRTAPEPSKRALYVGGLDPRVTEEVLKQIFETNGHVQSVKLISEKSTPGGSKSNYGFVEFDDPGSAERALLTLNGRHIHDREIRVNWAYQASQSGKEDTTSHHHIFVGDLSNEINDDRLLQAFSVFGDVSEARVMWDMKTGRSRGYGFVSYRERANADKAIVAMDGERLGSRAIRCNWANQKGQGPGQQSAGLTSSSPLPPQAFQHIPPRMDQLYEAVATQSPQWQTTCYVGNLPPDVSEDEVLTLFAQYGGILERRFQTDRGFAFIKMSTHEAAAIAISLLNGSMVHGRPIKCGWGKDRTPLVSPLASPAGHLDGYSPHQPHTPAFPPSPAGHYHGYTLSPTFADPRAQIHLHGYEIPNMISSARVGVHPGSQPITPLSPYGVHSPSAPGGMPVQLGAAHFGHWPGPTASSYLPNTR